MSDEPSDPSVLTHGGASSQQSLVSGDLLQIITAFLVKWWPSHSKDCVLQHIAILEERCGAAGHGSKLG